MRERHNYSTVSITPESHTRPHETTLEDEENTSRRTASAAECCSRKSAKTSKIALKPLPEEPMKSRTDYLTFEVPERMGFVNISREVQQTVDRSGVREGLCLVNAMHITASVFINDDEPGLHDDYERWLEELAPHEPTSAYRHNLTGEDNGDAHLKRQVMGREVVVAITRGELDFGTWERIFYGEFDGRRRKRVLVKIIGE